MFLARLVSKVKKELDEIEFNISGELEVLKVKGDFSLLALEGEDSCYLIEYYENGDKKDDIKVIAELENYGIKVGVVGFSDKIIVYKDFVKSGFYTYIDTENLNDEMIVRGLAKWYKKLHSVKGIKVDDYYKFFNLADAKKMIEKLNLEDNLFLQYVVKNFDNIKLKLDRLERHVICKEIDIRSIVVSKGKEILFVERLKTLYSGLRSMDIDYILSRINSELHRVFMEEYGSVSEEEFIVNDVVNCVVNLCIASKEEKFPLWGKKYLSLINDGDLLKKVKTLVEWF